MPKMPTTPKATMEYVVSFNGTYGGDPYGDEYMYSCDYQGDDVDALAEEVIAGDPNFPMTFVKNEDSGPIVGWFMSVDDNPDNVYNVAVMLHTEDFYG